MKRNIGHEILDGIHAIKGGTSKAFKVELPPDPKQVRGKMGLSQSAFAGLLGVSVRTLQEWEQGRRKPRGPACALLRVASKHPKALLS